MKYKEFHLKIKAAGWKYDHAEGSHYFYKKEIKDKDGNVIVVSSPPVPYHGAKEMYEGLRRSIAHKMGIK